MQINSVCEVPILAPETAYYKGCPALSRTRHIVAKKGACGMVRWEMRKPGGESVDLTDCFPDATEESLSTSLTSDTYTVRVRFADADVLTRNIYQVDAVVVENNPATVEFYIPSEICCDAGVYQMSVGLTPTDDDTNALFVETGLLSVEGDSLWGNTESNLSPPTLNDIRQALADFPESAELLGQQEFTADDIIRAMTWPIRQWNETPPPLPNQSCRSFPYRYHWRQAVVGQLLTQAAHYYLRNNMTVNHGGVSGNFKDKYADYMKMAQTYTQEWKKFVDDKKLELNARRAMGILGSSYARWTC